MKAEALVSAVPESSLEVLRELLAEHLGIRFSAQRDGVLGRALAAVAEELGFPDAETCLAEFLSSPMERRHLEALAAHVTVGETYFFRGPRTLAAFERDLLLPLIEARRASGRYLRIWSAGCATGEEPYSIAMLLARLIPDIEDWRITILATDINPRFLAKAEKGIYGKWSFRGAPEWIRGRCFRPAADGRLALLPGIRRMVHFGVLNLATDPFPSLVNGTNAMDFIFCRNVLMYFTPEAARRVAAKFSRCLVDGGCLIVSPVEMSAALYAPLVPVTLGDVTVYRKHTHVDDHGEALAVRREMPEAAWPGPVVESPPPRAEAVIEPPAMPAAVSAAPAETEHGELIAHFERGDFAAARQRALDILAGIPGDRQVLELLARSCANLGRLDEAERWCRALVDRERLDAGAHFLLGTILQERGAMPEAMESVKRALFLDPSLVLGHFTLGVMRRGQGFDTGAARDFRNALELLAEMPPDGIVPWSDGMTAGRLAEIIATLDDGGSAA
jgi:chemotaxis protein methyltransferase CheR